MVTLTLLQNKLVQIGLALTIGLGAGYYLNHKLAPPTTTTTTVHDVQQVKVEVPVLTDKIVNQIITDPKQQDAIARLIKENNDLKLKLVQISSTVASSHTSGGTDRSNPTPGTITTDPVVRALPTTNEDTAGKPANPVVASDDPSSTFKDYQLTATYSRTKFSYDLNQSFIIESSVGKDSNGSPIGITRLYQDTPTGLTPIVAKTTVIAADENLPRWFVSPRIQGGLGVNQDNVKSGFVGLQLLKRGTSKDPKDLKISVATVGVSVGNGTVKPSIIPINFNVGSPKLSPFSNLWIGPTIDLNKKVGIAITATF